MTSKGFTYKKLVNDYQMFFEVPWLPHLFHGPLDNKPLMACFGASTAPYIAEYEEGLRKDE
jgi:hypothetical protein